MTHEDINQSVINTLMAPCTIHDIDIYRQYRACVAEYSVSWYRYELTIYHLEGWDKNTIL